MPDAESFARDAELCGVVCSRLRNARRTCVRVRNSVILWEYGLQSPTMNSEMLERTAKVRRLRPFPQSSNGGPDPKETFSQLTGQFGLTCFSWAPRQIGGPD